MFIVLLVTFQQLSVIIGHSFPQILERFDFPRAPDCPELLALGLCLRLCCYRFVFLLLESFNILMNVVYSGSLSQPTTPLEINIINLCNNSSMCKLSQEYLPFTCMPLEIWSLMKSNSFPGVQFPRCSREECGSRQQCG